MYAYMFGKVTGLEPSYIEFECNDIGYLIKVANPYLFELGSFIKVYLYQKVSEDAIDLYGFSTKEEKELFIKLISVNGIGPKSALSILATGQVDDIANAIESNDVKYLMRFPGIGQKASQQIILDLKGKLEIVPQIVSVNSEVKEALIALGYKPKDVDKVISKLDGSKPTGELIKEALRLMLK